MKREMSSAESDVLNLHHWTSEDYIQAVLKQEIIYIAHSLINRIFIHASDQCQHGCYAYPLAVNQARRP
jgi:hypothetical protein